MNENRKKELEEQLKKMIDLSNQSKEREKQRKTMTGTGNIIRRRAGEKEKRFSI